MTACDTGLNETLELGAWDWGMSPSLLLYSSSRDVATSYLEEDVVIPFGRHVKYPPQPNVGSLSPPPTPAISF